MRFGEFYDTRKKCVIKQINKTSARKLYEQGKTVFLQSCNMPFNGIWQSACTIEKARATWGETFDTVINEFIYYNCDNERGKYPCFFVRKENA